MDAYRPKHFEVHPDNWEIVQLFLALSTQWVIAGMGSYVGINYCAVEPTARLAGIEMTPDVFGGLRLMESAALEKMRG